MIRNTASVRTFIPSGKSMVASRAMSVQVPRGLCCSVIPLSSARWPRKAYVSVLGSRH
jgi:hypothetical protein